MSIIPVSRVDIRIPQIRRNEQFLAFATVELAGVLTIHDVKVVRSGQGRILVLMPNRPHRVMCPSCQTQVMQVARFCQHCGERLYRRLGDTIDHHDIVHPVCHEQRAAIERAVLIAYANADQPHLKVLTA